MNNHFISIDSAELDKFFRQMDRFQKGKVAGVKKGVARATFDIAKNAKTNAPVKSGLLRSGISPEILNSSFTGQVKARTRYAAYREFGTGRLVRVPTGYEAYAMQFKGAGIRQVNSKPTPFLIPAVETERPKFLENIKQIFQRNEAAI